MTEIETKSRPAVVAGSFYPANPIELSRQIATLYSEAEKIPLPGRPVGLIAPHAGYLYSGLTAAKAYKQIEGEEYETVLIVCPSHTVFFKGASVYDGSAYETPLGKVQIDRELSDKIAAIHPSVYSSNMGHGTGSARGEHALEVQLPFLQIVLGNFRLVAIVMGDQEPETARALGEAMAAASKGTDTLLVASTDLSHFHTEKEARRLDAKIQHAIEEYDPNKLLDTLESGDGEACGGGSVASVMLASKRRSGSMVRLMDYTTSGSVTGDFNEVVGYLSAVIVASDRPTSRNPLAGSRAAEPETDHLGDNEKKFLRQTARKSIESRLHNKVFRATVNKRLTARKGLFVTVTLDGELRGCIGLIRSRQPLYESVAQMASEAAFEDPRFSPLTVEEFKRIELEISVLSPLKRIYEFDSIRIGKDGLMIKLDLHSGLLLPQVAVDNNWNLKEFLEQTCLKAGLSKDSYKNKFAEIYKFTSEVF